MRPLVTKKEMQALDAAAIGNIGIPAVVLMEVAGRAVADHTEALAKDRAVLAIAGLGNNGGDAIVAARHLHDRGLEVDLAIAGDPHQGSEDFKKQLAIAQKLGIVPLILDAGTELRSLFATYEVAIDGLFGTGLSRPIEGLVKKIIEALNDAKLDVVAVDIASGIDADTGQILGAAVRAKKTVTFQHAKLGHALYPGREHTGVLELADIGIPRALLKDAKTFILDDFRLEKRSADTHKGTYGHVLVVAGVADRPGSALLAARAALRTGAGLVTIGSDPETIRRIAPVLDELMGMPLALDAAKISEAANQRSALAIGPSLPGDASTQKMLIELFAELEVPAIIDAGALAALGTEVGEIAGHRAPLVLTPHPGEMAKLLGASTQDVQADRLRAARTLAEKTNATVVLKGASTIVAEPISRTPKTAAGETSGEPGRSRPAGRTAIVLRGNPGMATGGAGDVLTGIVGSLLAQGHDAFDAACGGVMLHAKAGDRAARSGEARLIASDIIAALALAEDTAP